MSVVMNRKLIEIEEAFQKVKFSVTAESLQEANADFNEFEKRVRDFRSNMGLWNEQDRATAPLRKLVN